MHKDCQIYASLCIKKFKLNLVQLLMKINKRCIIINKFINSLDYLINIMYQGLLV